MIKTIGFILLGYFSGSVLYARIFAKLFKKDNLIENSKDKNPGTANAFMYGGFRCGLLTLVFDLAKGFLPVSFYIHQSGAMSDDVIFSAMIIAAPVIGHAFPVFYKFRGGKGIAVSFGCLLGLLPLWQPLIILAFFFILFSVVLRISPHFYRTFVSYISALVCMFFLVKEPVICIGFSLITAVVVAKLLFSKEKREKPEVSLLWKR